jgi:ribosomal protein S18 acetylase RimI-like enzyme
MNYEIREAIAADGEAMLALMPRLADFDVPESRNPQHLYGDDAKLLQRWLDGKEECLVQVAEDDEQQIVGFTLVRLRPELLSSEPSAHLEAITVSESAEGKGIARALLDAAEQGAKDSGALTMTLHVFASNTRARAFYDRSGYDGELIRYIKEIG